MKVEKLWITPDPEYQIVRSARICYNSMDKIDSTWEMVGLRKTPEGKMQLSYPVMKVSLGKNDKELLEKLVSKKHGMALRFASAAFSVSGISRVCSHQLVRIAHFGILQRSQRYVEESSANMVLSEDFPDKYKPALADLHKEAQDFYEEMVRNGVPKEEARYALLNGTETALNLSANFQAWSHFFSIRLQDKVQKETYEVARELWRQLYIEAPTVFGKFK